MTCLFCGIIEGSIPASVCFENERILAFDDIAPKAPVHKLIIPKQHIATINDLHDDQACLTGELLLVAKQLAKTLDIAEPGYRVIMNCNPHGGQEVFHIHLHLLGGKPLGSLVA